MKTTASPANSSAGKRKAVDSLITSRRRSSSVPDALAFASDAISVIAVDSSPHVVVPRTTVEDSRRLIDEVSRIADVITVINRGRVIGTLPAAGAELERAFFDVIHRDDVATGAAA